jgi:hypothetical protein
MWSPVQSQGLADEVVSEGVYRFVAHELETGALIDPADRGEHVIRPELDCGVAVRGRNSTHSATRRFPTPRPRGLDEQEPELGRPFVRAGQAEHAADVFAVGLGDLRRQRLEVLVAAILLRVENALPVDNNPAETAGAGRTEYGVGVVLRASTRPVIVPITRELPTRQMETP